MEDFWQPFSIYRLDLVLLWCQTEVMPQRSLIPARFAAHASVFSGSTARLGRKVVDGRFVKKRLEGLPYGFVFPFPYWAFVLSIKAWKLWATG